MPESWLAGLAGGLLIGLASAAYLLLAGRIAGITGLLRDAVLTPRSRTRPASIAFMAGAFAAPLAVVALGGPATVQITTSTAALLASGVLVGIGVTASNGCTSGHGVCGLARASTRSAAAVLTFMAMTAFSATVVRGWPGLAP